MIVPNPMSVLPAIMSNPSYWALFIDNMAIFRLLNQQLLQCFLLQPSLKSFSLLQMFNRLNSRKRKGGKGRGLMGEMERGHNSHLSPSPPHICLSRRLHPLPIFSVVYSLIYTSSQFTYYVMIILATFETVWVELPGLPILCFTIKRPHNLISTNPSIRYFQVQ